MSENDDNIVVAPDGLLNISDVRRLLVLYWRLGEVERERVRRFISLYPECPDKYNEVLDENYPNP